MFGGLIDDQISPRVMSSSPPLSAAVEPRIFCFYSVLPVHYSLHTDNVVTKHQVRSL